MSTSPATQHAADHPPVDVLVVGGGPAGLAAALMLGRSRRRVLVVDAGEPRNAPADGLHGYLTRDGTPPRELLALGREEVAGYGVEVRDGRVVGAERVGRRFRVELEDGSTVVARRLVVTTGLVDKLPDVDGLAERWGRDVVHCPYCHGWEVRDQVIGVLATTPAALHQAGLFRQLSDRVVLLRHTADGFDEDTLAGLVARGVEVVGGEVMAVEVADDRLTGVRLADGRTVALEALAVAARFRVGSPLLAALGLDVVDHPSGMGVHVPSGLGGRSDVPGVWMAGNVTEPFAQVVGAAAQGSLAGAHVNADLVDEDLRHARAMQAIHDPELAEGERWDLFYRRDGEDALWSGRPNRVLVDEVADLAPGRALDVGCGEGGDAVWLAGQGWSVTALDPSAVALDRASLAAERLGADVDWLHGGLLDLADVGVHDLVTAQYPVLEQSDDDAAIAALLAAVAPGGTLLVVHHDLRGEPAHAHGFDPDRYVLPTDVRARLGDGWTVEVDEVRDPPPGAPEHRGDLVLRARRDH